MEEQADTDSEDDPERARLDAIKEALGPERWATLLQSPEESARAVAFLEEKLEALEEEHKSLKQRFEDAKKETKDLEGALEDKTKEAKSLQDELRREREKKEDKPSARPGSGAGKLKAVAPSEMAGKLAEYEQTIAANEKLIEGLRTRAESDHTEMEEMKAALKREKKAGISTRRS